MKGQASGPLPAVRAEQVDPGGRGQQAPEAGVMQEDGFLDVRDDATGVADAVPAFLP
jgi:hypothetical protein